MNSKQRKQYERKLVRDFPSGTLVIYQPFSQHYVVAPRRADDRKGRVPLAFPNDPTRACKWVKPRWIYVPQR